MSLRSRLRPNYLLYHVSIRWMAKWLLCAAEDRALWANKRQMMCVCERDREVCAVELV